MVDDRINVTEQDMEDLAHNIRLYQDIAKKQLEEQQLEDTNDNTDVE